MIESFYNFILKLIVYLFISISAYRKVILSSLNLKKIKKVTVVDSKCIPNHVCAIFNDITYGDDTKQIISSLIQRLSSIGVKNIDVYLPDLVYAKLNQGFMNEHNLVNLKILSSSNSGKGILVQGLQDIAKKVLNDDLKVDEISESIISKAICDSTNIEEPDLVISIGLIEKLSGFSPWHLKNSEILNLPSTEFFNDSISIEDLMMRYSKIEKRFGK